MSKKRVMYLRMLSLISKKRRITPANEGMLSAKYMNLVTSVTGESNITICVHKGPQRDEQIDIYVIIW